MEYSKIRIWIHGAFASKNSFNYMKTQMKNDDELFFEYDCNTRMIEKIEKMVERVERLNNEVPVDIIGHSLGGVIGTIITQESKTPIRSLVTLSAPFGGITNNPLLKYWFTKSVFKEFNEIQKKYGHINNEPIGVPHKIFVTTNGKNPLFFGKANDGVVTIESQQKINSTELIKIPLNHYEVLMSSDVTDDIKGFYKKL